MNKIYWQPTPADLADSLLARFRDRVAAKHHVQLPDYAALHAWSVNDSPNFWADAWDFCGIIGQRGARTLVDGARFPGAQWFPDAAFNYAENLLKPAKELANHPAIYFWAEDKIKLQLSWAELRAQVAAFANFLRQQGVVPGDRVAALVSDTPEAVIAALGASAVGAIFSSCSPDFGEQLVLDRFAQITPKVLVATTRYLYKGKTLDDRAKLSTILAQLPSVQQVVTTSYLDDQPIPQTTVPQQSWQNLQKNFATAELVFAQQPFNHPLFILYSSGTTGLPKCFVHSQGGMLLRHMVEHQLHCDVRPRDVVFYFTTCGWMMWNWQISALASGATLALYDGSPVVNDGNILFDYADAVGATLFGTSAPYVQAIKNLNLRPKATHSLKSIRLLTSTGAPLLHEHFDYLYENVLGAVPVASISGGSDICACFVLGNRLSPVHRGEIQGPGLGFALDVLGEQGQPLQAGQGAGELVCRQPFPNMPVAFWNDADGQKYRAAYFEKYPNIWCHGDWIEKTPSGGFIIYGRSDATTKRQGVRIGTAEFYNIIEPLPEVDNSLVVGWQTAELDKIIVFVRLAAGYTLDEALKQKISTTLRAKGSPRHVPDEIVATPDIPQTRNAKKAEMAVLNIFHGKPVTNLSALANPDSLKFYEEYVRNYPR